MMRYPVETPRRWGTGRIASARCDRVAQTNLDFQLACSKAFAMESRSCFTLGLIGFLIASSSITFGADQMERLAIDNRAPRSNTSLVVPNYLPSQDFFEASHTFLEPMRVQQVYSATEFGERPMLITGFYWRPCADPQYGFAFHTVLPDFQINLSTTSKQPDQLSLVFAENSGRDEKMVFKGRLAISSRFQESVGNTKAFDIFVPLQHPFVYRPESGNLLVDIRCFQSSDASYVGEYGAYGDSGSRVYALDPDATTASVADTGIDVIKVVFARAGRPSLPVIEHTQFSNPN